MSAHNIFHQENVKPDEKGTGLTPDFGGGSSTYKVAEAILGALEDA